MAQRRGNMQPIVETFLETNEETIEMTEPKKKRYGMLMSKFRRNTIMWTINQRRRFCYHANYLLRCLKKSERLELHTSGNKMIIRVARVRVRCRRQHNEEIGSREGNRRRVKRTHQKTGRRAADENSELSELRDEIKKKERLIRRKNVDIQREKRYIYSSMGDIFGKLAKTATAMKLVLDELPLESKPMKKIKLHKEAESGARDLVGVGISPLSDEPPMVDQLADIFRMLVDGQFLVQNDDDIFIDSNKLRMATFEPLETLLKDLEQLQTEKGAFGSRLKAMEQKLMDEQKQQIEGDGE